MIKIQGLISAYFTPFIEEMLEYVRKEEDISIDEFSKLLEEEQEQIFPILETKCAEYFIAKYTVAEFRKQYQITQNNSNKIISLNESLFHYFFAYIHTANIVYANFLKELDNFKTQNDELELKDTINLIFYGNLCRIADQVGIQLINGYSDGALRLWRTFYEHCVVAIFLMKNNSNELAARFRDASHKENKKSVESYGKRHIDLKFPPLSEELISRVLLDFEQAKNNHQKDFFDSDYGWAKPFLSEKANFSAIETATGLNRYRPFYIWVSGMIHPTYKGITNFRGDSQNIILKRITAQETKRQSFIDPAQLTLSVFHEVNNHFLHLYSGHEYEINQLLFRKIYDQFSKTLSP